MQASRYHNEEQVKRASVRVCIQVHFLVVPPKNEPFLSLGYANFAPHAT